MCVAILIRPGARISLEKLRTGFDANPDGAGYAFTDGTKVQVRRSLNWRRLEHLFVKDVEKYGDTSAFMVHFRAASHGTVNKQNCHPYRMADGGAMIHNGVIPISGRPDHMSDTRWFVESIIDTMPENWTYRPEWWSMVDNMIGGYSKLVFLWPNNEYRIVNERAGHWESSDGSIVSDTVAADEDLPLIWYSNYSCNPKVKTPQEATSRPAKRGSGSRAALPAATTPTPSATGDGEVSAYSAKEMDPDIWVRVPGTVNKWRMRTPEERAERIRTQAIFAIASTEMGVHEVINEDGEHQGYMFDECSLDDVRDNSDFGIDDCIETSLAEDYDELAFYTFCRSNLSQNTCPVCTEWFPKLNQAVAHFRECDADGFGMFKRVATKVTKGAA